MDLTMKILKLAALGWDGKEPALDFFYRVYRIKVYFIEDKDKCGKKKIVITNRGSIRISIKARNIDPVRYCLRLFRTEDGKVIGPRQSNFFRLENEWT